MGMSCIEDWSKNGFNCSVACEGVYVDIEWEDDNLLKGNTGKANNGEQKKGDILSGKSFAKMIKEYSAYKKHYAQQFRYDAHAESTNFGQYDFGFCFITHLSRG